MVVNATGLWTGSDYGSTPKFTAGNKKEASISKKDREILRRLATRVLELSDCNIEEEKRSLWTLHNTLKTKRPVVFCDPENGWNEIIKEDMVKCTGELARRWEIVLRKEIFWAEAIKDDKVIEPNFDIGYTYADNNWGFSELKVTGGDGGSYIWEPSIVELGDAKKIKYPDITIDKKTTIETIEAANDVFGDILNIRLVGKWWWTLGLTIDLVFLRGLENIMWDMIDNQNLFHEMMDKLMNGTLNKLEYLEDNGLLSLDSDRYVGSGGFGYTYELPQLDYDGKAVRTKDIWGFGDSQETGGVSPGMFEEFVFRYQLPILEKFGLNCYGCCEALDSRWHIIKRIPNLRRVSVSPWANIEKMAENLEDKYIFSLKTSPTALAVPVIDKESIRKSIHNALMLTKGCVLEIIMKDNHTLGNRPDNIIEWARIAKEEVIRMQE